MKRLSFLLLATAIPALAHPNHDKAPAGKPVSEVITTGNGQFTFKTVPGWGALPDGKNIGPTHGGVAVDSKGFVYVSTDAKHGIVKFDKTGKFVKFFEGKHGFHSLGIIKEGDQEYLYGANVRGAYFAKLTLDGKEVFRIPNENTGNVPGSYQRRDKEKKLMVNEDGSPSMVSAFKGLTGAAVADDGHIFLSCGYGSNLVHKFDKTGKHLKSFGGRSGKDRSDPMRFVTCHGLAIDKRFGDPRLLVVDRENGRLMHYDFDFKFIQKYAEHLRRPCAVSIRKDECVVAELAGRVTLLDKRGAEVAFLGDNPDKKQRANFGVPKDKMTLGVFTAPHGCSFDADGNVIVQDWNKSGRVTFLDRQ